ncbi:MAG: S1C family serine protease [Cyanophyceae cyanobacterium]
MLTSTDNLLSALSKSIADTVQTVGQSVVAVHGSRRSSSGIHWQPGIIVTSDEMIKREEAMTVTLPSGQTVPVTVAGRDASTDVAVLKLLGEELPPTANIGQPTALQVGHLVLAVGRSREQGLSASLGAISLLGQSWQSMRGGLIDQLIRPDLTLYSEGAGGPLVDAGGTVVGFNTFGPRRSVLTIPATTVQRVLDQLLKQGRVARGYLGLGMQPVALPDTLSRRFSLSSQRGVIVVSVESGGPGDRSGIFLGDVLVAINGTAVTDTGDIQAVLGPQSVGQTLAVQLLRGGELIEVSLEVGERGR